MANRPFLFLAPLICLCAPSVYAATACAPPKPSPLSQWWDSTLLAAQRRMLLSLPSDPEDRTHPFDFLATEEADTLHGESDSTSPWVPPLGQTRNCTDLGPVDTDWETTTELLCALRDFLPLYAQRPIKANLWGVRLTHAFGLYVGVKRAQPAFVVESGVYMGQTTWLLRQAAPHAIIVSLDPSCLMEYCDPLAVYYTQRPDECRCRHVALAMRPFQDLSAIDWASLRVPNPRHRTDASAPASLRFDPSRALAFVDDHQSAWRRVQELRQQGFLHLAFDDNWGPLQGDCYSLKQLCDRSGGAFLFPYYHNLSNEQLGASYNVLTKDNFASKNRQGQFPKIPLSVHRQRGSSLRAAAVRYFEARPLLFHPLLLKGWSNAARSHARRDRDWRWLYTRSYVPLPLVTTHDQFVWLGLGNRTASDFENYGFLAHLQLGK
eukprot:TRINITY_DN41473_c0_g1_i1.p1 TRINITY_DN41473_c0_g1~~TRINITY_DN41473_c0_g1_i1.p1  ORF type:complete len:444 (-),score=47.09 TRINITY_DN41473_c0_g1_i1:192-1496(-)